MKQSLLNALRKGTDVVLNQFGTEITLTPHKRVDKGGGVYDWERQPDRNPQVFYIEPVSATLVGITGAGGGITNVEGAKAHTWSYSLTGRFDSDIEIGDVWVNGQTNYRVISLNPFNNYEKVATVTAIGKDPSYGT